MCNFYAYTVRFSHDSVLHDLGAHSTQKAWSMSISFYFNKMAVCSMMLIKKGKGSVTLCSCTNGKKDHEQTNGWEDGKKSAFYVCFLSQHSLSQDYSHHNYRLYRTGWSFIYNGDIWILNQRLKASQLFYFILLHVCLFSYDV